jgi:DNA/RNA endonuclease YhcR with UshA esterase domain
MKIPRALAAAGVAVWLGAVPVLAHHSFAVQYDKNKPMTVKGVVTKVEWTNPHARFYIDVKDDKGAVTQWNFEIASPNVLIRNGWKPNSLKIGEQVTVDGFEQRIRPASGPLMAIAEGVTAADGRKMFASAQSDLAR